MSDTIVSRRPLRVFSTKAADKIVEWQDNGFREYLTINEWGWVSYEELWRSRRALSVEAVGRGG